MIDTTTLKTIRKENMERLKCAENLVEGIEYRKQSIDDIYTELYIIDGESECEKSQNELRQMEVEWQRETPVQPAINCNDIFIKPSSKPGTHIRTVMTKGIAGIGKTMAVKKFISDWTQKRANQDVNFIFLIPFCQLNVYLSHQYSLQNLLHYFSPNISDVELIHTGKIIIIFDGLDESKFTLDFEDMESLSCVTEVAKVDKLIVNLLKKNLLPSASIWITSRPTATHQIPSIYIDRWTEIQGFNDEQKDHFFKNNIEDENEALRIMTHIRNSRSLYIMCRIPVFCWILVTVFLQMGTKDRQEIPQTLTEIFAHFLRIQFTMKAQKYKDLEEKDVKLILKSNKELILKLAKLAYKQLENGNILCYEDDLKAVGIDNHEDLEKSGMCTEVFVSVLPKKEVYRFVHLTIQEFLAALFVFYSSVNDNVRELQAFDLNRLDLLELLESAVRRALESPNGHLDLFLRFLLGIALESNQKLFEGLLENTQKCSDTITSIVQHIKDTISMSHQCTERCMNLLLCLLELKDNSLHKEVEKYVKLGQLLSPAMCSTLAYIMLVSENIQDEFDLSKYHATDKAKGRLVIAVRSCKKGR